MARASHRGGSTPPRPPVTRAAKGGWRKCEGCSATLYDAAAVAALWVCHRCGYHHQMPTAARIELLVDPGTWLEHDGGLTSTDPLAFHVDGQPYRALLDAAVRNQGSGDAYRAGSACIDSVEAELGVFAFEFMGGSMGAVVGEKISRQFERALARKVPAVVCCASGGARMQEGAYSLMQMAKSAVACARLREAGLPYVSVLLHPTTGGVAASIATLGDVIIAESGALIGFAGPRVIEQTLRQHLPVGFQRAEALLERGLIDLVAPRPRLKATLARTLRWLAPPRREARMVCEGGVGGG